MGDVVNSPGPPVSMHMPAGVSLLPAPDPLPALGEQARIDVKVTQDNVR